MDEVKQLKQTKMRFESEIERVFGSNFANMPRPLEQLIDAIECEPPLEAHFSGTVATLVPDDFDARQEVKRVSSSGDEVFGPFESHHTAAAAEAYLILQELVKRRTKFHDPIFSGYDNTDYSLPDRFSSFVDEVVMLVVDEARSHLQTLMEPYAAQMAEESAVQDERAQTKRETPTPEPKKTSPEKLRTLLDELREATATLASGDREDALLEIDALQDELLCDKPKERVIRALVRVLRSFDGGVAYEVSLDRLARAL